MEKEFKNFSLSDSVGGGLKNLNEGLNQAMVSISELGKDFEDIRTAPLAEGVCKRIVKEIIDFEAKLPEEYQAGGRLVSFAGLEAFSIIDIKYSNPNLLIFYGELPDGSKVRLVQHQSQLNLMLLAVRRPEPEIDKPRRKIGFSIEESQE